MAAVFRRLELSGWRQFARVEIEFHDRLTVLTGANGSGKSTLLNVLASHVGAERAYLGVPTISSDGLLRYIVGRIASSSWWRTFFKTNSADDSQIGEIEYSDLETSPIKVPKSDSLSYQIIIERRQSLNGVVIGSHRLMPSYQRLQHMQFGGVPPDQAFGTFTNEANLRYRGEQSSHSLIFQIKQALASWAIVGEGNKTVAPDWRQHSAYNGFIQILRKVLPEEVGFIDLAIRPPEVVLVTKSGEFLIDAASGGVTSLIEIVALIYACSIQPSVRDQRFVVVYDEPENHLHPQLQRSLLRNLTNAFPNAQFIVATHSPFIVSSLKDSNVYVLRHRSSDANPVDSTEEARVVSEKLDYANRAGTASEILREVLGLPSTLPEWVEADLDRIVQQYRNRSIDNEVLVELRADLEKAGLGDLFPEALVGLGRDR